MTGKPHGDGGKQSHRRNEDVAKVRSNWDLVDWTKTPTGETKEAPKEKESK
jgi:hypothetical protein